MFYYSSIHFIPAYHVLRQPQIGRAVQLLFKRHLKVPFRFLQVREVIQTSLTAYLPLRYKVQLILTKAILYSSKL